MRTYIIIVLIFETSYEFCVHPSFRIHLLSPCKFCNQSVDAVVFVLFRPITLADFQNASKQSLYAALLRYINYVMLCYVFDVLP